MKNRALNFLYGLLLAAALLTCLLAGGCATERYAPAVDAQVDSTMTAAGLPPLHVYKLKLTGPVNITVQAGQGNTSTSAVVGTDKRGQRSQGRAALAALPGRRAADCCAGHSRLGLAEA
jgi:hypothetical protein